jgi:hypothetical protein
MKQADIRYSSSALYLNIGCAARQGRRLKQCLIRARLALTTKSAQNRKSLLCELEIGNRFANATALQQLGISRGCLFRQSV